MDVTKIKEGVKKVLFNKNTITLILVLVLIVVIYFIYSYMIEKATNPVSLPYATELLKANTVIENENVSTLKVSGTFLTATGSTILQSRGRIIGYQVKTGYQIPQYSFFYTDAVVEKNTTATDDFYNLPDGYTIYALPVDFHSTYGNSIMPGNYIDLYFKSTINEKVVFEKFITSIEVYRVYDSSYQDVFSNADDEEEANPKYIYFAVRDDIHELLKVCEEIAGVEIVPVPRNASYSENPEEMEIANLAVRDYIISQKYEISN